MKLLCPWDSPGKNTGVGCHFLLQGIFLTQGLNPHLLHLRHFQVGSWSLVPPGKPLANGTWCQDGYHLVVNVRPHEYWVSHITLVYLEVHEYLLPLGPWSMFSNTYFTNFVYCCCFVAKSCPTICNPMDCRPPGSSVHGFFPARILGWVAISFSRGSSQSRDQAKVSCIGRC